MKKYALLNQDNVLVSYSDFPIENYTHTASQKDGSTIVSYITCVADVTYNSDNIGKVYDIETEQFS